MGWYLALFRRPVARNARAVMYGIKSLFYGTRAHNLCFAGRKTPDHLRFIPIDPWPGNADRGRAIIRGQFTFAGRSHQIGAERGGALWDGNDQGGAWLAALHEFNWLRDLRVAGGDGARMAARALVLDWINCHGAWHRVSWRPDILAARICAWIASADFLCPNRDPEFATAFLDSLSRQSRHLLRQSGGGLSGPGRLAIVKGQVFAAAALFGNTRALKRALGRLDTELTRQILADGGHNERSPSRQLAVLRDLVDIRAILVDAAHPVPQGLQNAIDRMAPMLRFFRHGDGGLALFNDSDEGEAWLTDMVLSRADAPGKPHLSAPHSGFERITANRTLLIADMGTPPPNGARDHVFAGTLSFEMSIGKERLITNCGGGANLGPNWRQGLRATAAHSTLTLGDTNSTEIFEVPGRGGEIGKHPTHVTRQRSEADGATWLVGRHDGYMRGFKLVHERRLWLAAGGEELRGEDVLLATGDADHRRNNGGKDGTKSTSLWPWRRGRPRSFAVRFHIHPGVSVSPMQEAGAVLLRLPSGAGWRFRAEGGNVTVENSIYVGGTSMRRGTQIVITGGVLASGPRPGATIRWAIARMAER